MRLHWERGRLGGYDYRVSYTLKKQRVLHSSAFAKTCRPTVVANALHKFRMTSCLLLS